MKKITYFIFLVFLSACGHHKQELNNFRSNTDLHYIKPQQVEEHALSTDSTNLPNHYAQLLSPNHSKANATDQNDDVYFSKGDQIKVVLVTGYINDDYESFFEKHFSLGRVRNEISIATTVKEVGPHSNSSKPKNTVILENGQLANRFFDFKNVTIYGPTKYEGGDIEFLFTVNELDDEDLKFYGEDAFEFAVDSTGLNTSTSINILDPNLLALDYVSFGVQTLKVAGKAIVKIHSPEDSLVKKTFTLCAKNDSDIFGNDYIRQGLYALIRISSNVDHKRDINYLYDYNREEIITAKKTRIDNIWLLMKIIKVGS